VYDTVPSETPSTRLTDDRPISIAILAMGGQGGGVLSDWIIAVAESQGWAAQSTSVPGVAQRTGATIYYIEMLPPRGGRMPVLSLVPTPGDVDIVLAAELMEAGRAMLRGFVNPERTTLIASSHRSYAVVEKTVPGDGGGDPMAVVEAAGITARRIVAFDMQDLAEKNGSVISATMLGALASTEGLPFPRSAFEDAIRAGGKGTEASLKAFSAAFDRARAPSVAIKPELPSKDLPELPARAGHPDLDRLLDRIRAGFPAACQPMVFAGVTRLVDYQDVAYAHEYLDRLDTFHRADLANDGGSRGFAFTQAAAKYLAVAFAYDDVIRVADLKTRAARFARVRREVGARDDQVLHTTEYMHPRIEEVLGVLPAGIGRFVEARPRLRQALDRIVNRGRRVRTDTILVFVALAAVGQARSWRRRSYRHLSEMAHVENWLAVALAHVGRNYDLATEVLACRRLVKGYSDTHARGLSKFDRVLAMADRLADLPDGAAWLRRLKQAALKDESGEALEGAIKTVTLAYAP
jgi:indolepyruvate ferredoxin oxidoreductase beta subunit